MENKRLVLSWDELRRFEAKAGIQGSALLPMVNELFESNRYQNRTKDQNLRIEDGHFAFISNSTEETWHGLHNAPEFKDSGFLNRMFLLPGSTNKRIARPTAPAAHQIQPLVADLGAKFAALPALNGNGSASSEVVLPFTATAGATWDAWYCNVPQLPETARLDTIGPRLMAVLAFVSGKTAIDDDVMRATLALLDFQQQVRVEYAPIIAVNQAASMEEKIRRALKKYGPLNDRDLRRHTNGDRVGPGVLAGNTAIGYIQRDSTGEWQMGLGAMRLASSLVVGCRQTVDDGQMIEGTEDICIFLYVVTPPRTPA